MINSNYTTGDLNCPIKWADVKETLITQLMKSSGSERAVHELLTDCPACQSHYYRKKSITLYFAFNNGGYPVHPTFLDVTSNKNIYLRWLERGDNMYLFTRSVPITCDWYHLHEKEQVLRDIYAALIEILSFKQLFFAINTLVANEICPPLISFWIFQQELYHNSNIADAYYEIDNFCKDMLSDYCDFIIINHDELPAYFKKDINMLIAMANRVYRSECLSFTNLKYKITVNILLDWIEQFKLANNKTIFNFVLGGCVMTSHQFSLTALTEFLANMPHPLPYFTSNVRAAHDRAFKCERYPFTFKITNKEEIDKLINLLATKPKCLSVAIAIMKYTQAKIDIRDYQSELANRLKLAVAKPQDKTNQRIIQIIKQVFKYQA